MGRSLKNLRRGGNSPKKPKSPIDPQVNKSKGGGGIGKGPTGPGIDK